MTTAKRKRQESLPLEKRLPERISSISRPARQIMMATMTDREAADDRDRGP